MENELQGSAVGNCDETSDCCESSGNRHRTTRERLEAAIISMQERQDRIAKKLYKALELLHRMDEDPTLAKVFEAFDEVL